MYTGIHHSYHWSFMDLDRDKYSLHEKIGCAQYYLLSQVVTAPLKVLFYVTGYDVWWLCIPVVCLV